MVAASKGTLSLRATDDVEGGLFDDYRGKVTEARYAMYDYAKADGTPGTKDGQPVLVARITIENVEVPDAKPNVQYYSVGAKGFVPNDKDGGRTAVSDGTARGISKTSNLAKLRNELVSIGFPEEKITDDISFLDGLDAHWNKKAQPKRPGDQQESKPLLLPTKIYEVSSASVAKKGTAVKSSKKAAATAETGADDKQKAIATVVDLLAAKKSIAIAKIKMDCFRAHLKDTDTRNLVTAIVDPEKGGLEFFAEGEAEGLWKFDGETIAAA